MQELQIELMMAVIVASTAFAGLMGIIIWQIMQNDLVIGRLFKTFLCISFLFGIIAALLALGYLYFTEPTYARFWYGKLAMLSFTFQIIFSLVLPLRFIYAMWK